MRWCASKFVLVALAGVLAACGAGCEGTQRGAGSRGTAGANGAPETPGSTSGVRANEWGLVVRTWVIDDTRGTQVDVVTSDPNAVAGPEPEAGPAAEPTEPSRRMPTNLPPPAGGSRPDGSRTGGSARGGEGVVAPDIRPLRPDWRAAIAAVAVAPPVDAATLEAWRANGIELIGVPMERMAALESVLSTVGFRQSQDMGETPRWTQVCAGPAWNGEQRLVLDNGPVVLGPGRLRLLLRTWVVPGVTEPLPVRGDAEVVMGSGTDGDEGEAPAQPAEMVPGAVRVEMAPQHAEAAAGRTTLADLLKPLDDETRDAGEGAARAGLIMSRLTAAATLNGDTALLVLASDAGLQAVGDPTTGGGGGWMAQKPDRVGTTTVGPMMSGDMRLGPAILTSGPDGGEASGAGIGGQRSWTVLILIPRVPDRYELLGL